MANLLKMAGFQAPIASAMPAEPAGPRPGAGQSSDCAAYPALIVAGLEQCLSAKRIFQDLVTDHGFRGGCYSVLASCGAASRARSCQYDGRSALRARKHESISAPALGCSRRTAGGVGRTSFAWSSVTRARPTARSYRRCLFSAEGNSLGRLADLSSLQPVRTWQDF
jgi:hypothetical protein